MITDDSPAPSPSVPLLMSDGFHDRETRAAPAVMSASASHRHIVPPPIGVIGTGNFAIAITARLVSSGYRVVIGSRKPSQRQAAWTNKGDCLCGTELTTIPDCLRRCDVIVVAVHMENFKVTLQPLSELTRGKVLVDVSNRESRYASRSNAQYLASLLPTARVAKAFNTVSAMAMESSLDMTVGRQKVFVACDDKQARATVLDLSKAMGFHAIDFGGLKNSIYLEDFVLKVFPNWKIPIFLTFGIFNLWSLYIVYIYFVEKTAYQWEQIFLKVLNKPVCMTAITALALTYLPGQIASILQVWRGTKHSQFPRILDSWLKSRKQFGLIAFFLVAFHVVASTLMLSPTYYRSWFHQAKVILPANTSSLDATSQLELPVTPSWMVYKAELALLFGIVAFLGMSIQAVTSIEGVASTLNWSEWRCVQSNLGTYVLIMAAGHVISMGAPGWAKIGFPKTFLSITFLSLILPMIVLLLKFVFRWTPLKCYLAKIRRGWERDKDKSTNQSSGLDIEKQRICSEDNLLDKSILAADKKCGCGEDFQHLSIIEEKCCACNDDSSRRNDTKVRFATNTKCGCSSV